MCTKFFINAECVLDVDEDHEQRQQEQHAGEHLGGQDRRRERAASAEPVAGDGERGEYGDDDAEDGGRRGHDDRVHEVASERHRLPHVEERRYRRAGRPPREVPLNVLEGLDRRGDHDEQRQCHEKAQEDDDDGPEDLESDRVTHLRSSG